MFTMFFSTLNVETSMCTYRLQGLLCLDLKRAALHGDDIGGGVRVVGDGRPALAAEDAVDGVARRALAGPAFGGARDGHLVLLADEDEGCGGVEGQYRTWGEGGKLAGING